MISSPLKSPQSRILLIAGITALMLLGAGVGAILFEEKSYRTHKAANFTSQAKMLASIVPAALAFNNQDELNEYLSALTVASDIKVAAIYNSDGNLAAKTEGIGEPPAVLKKPTPFQLSQNLITITVPIEQRGLLIGHVYVSAEVEPITRRFTLYALIIVMTSIGALVVLGLTNAYLMQRKYAFELRDKADALAQINSQLIDSIANREKIEAALRQAHKMEALGKMTGGVAHDFNNLLHVVKLNLTAMLWSGDVKSNPILQEAINICVKTVERGATLTQQLLAFARRQPLSPQLFDINTLLAQTTPLIQPILGSSIRLDVQKSDIEYAIMADQHQLESALLNLAINARDAMPNGGSLTVNSTLEYIDKRDELIPGNYVAIHITDTGMGIPANLIDKVFEPFFTTKTVGKGSGLGLSQVYGYIKQSGGDVVIKTAENEGTCITLLLPAYAPSAHDDLHTKAIENSDQLPPSTVLVVEDEEVTLLSTANLLRGMGLRPLIAANADEALALLKIDQSIAILFSDIVLPGQMNGLQLAVKSRQLYPNLEILLATGYAGDNIFEADELKQFPLIRKPYGAHELRTQLVQITNH